jgi:tRNA 2-thiouridine synthesizing protein A
LTIGPPAAILVGVAMIILDLMGLKCPLPVLKTRKALTGLRPGDLLQVHCTDPLAALDIPNLVRETGDRMASAEHGAEAIVFVIEKA